VIVHIGDNGPVYYADLLRLKAALAGVPLVVIVNVRVATSWQSEVNSELGQAVAGWHEATIADWYDASAGGGAVADGTHTTIAGAELFAALISRAVHARGSAASPTERSWAAAQGTTFGAGAAAAISR